ncbi:DUF6801 domain-containing protein [Aeromicrobium choanae]|uniref:DUF6801 domain-containing protein n=1 Tax=Aeromicrobium choanae TaxID=1736691 RepID=A0A1T4YXD6_9ACTN|nr:DUF6801 domain-containing protein [Aeromicrobium choanae]SKB06444.1 hypothetical protein SAMN06295964_1316 [Aeromicrobium choanae]
MTRTAPLARRLAVPVSATLIAGMAGALTMAGAGTANAADVRLSKNFTYNCAVTAGPLDLGRHNIGVAISTTVPTSVRAGQTVPARAVNITLTLPEDLRAATSGLLQGREAAGASTDASLTLTSGGRSTAVRIPSLAAPRTPVPQNVGAAWTIPATGTVPAFKAPATTKHTVALGVPKAFTIAATIYRADESTVPSNLTCTGPANLALGSIKVPNRAPVASKKTVKVVTKSKKAKSFVIRAKDADGDRLTYKAGKLSKKVGKVSGKGPKFKFVPNKKFKGKKALYVTVRDGYGGSAKVKVIITVKK